MNRWEKVYTQVLAAYVANNKVDMMDRLLNNTLQTHANLIGVVVRTITNAAISEMDMHNINEGETNGKL